jgi:hypothetical protein
MNSGGKIRAPFFEELVEFMISFRKLDLLDLLTSYGQLTRPSD